MGGEGNCFWGERKMKRRKLHFGIAVDGIFIARLVCGGIFLGASGVFIATGIEFLGGWPGGILLTPLSYRVLPLRA
jgi:hypothetical protein